MNKYICKYNFTLQTTVIVLVSEEKGISLSVVNLSL